MTIETLFDPVNGTTFKYYPHFISFYGALFVAYIALKFYRKKLDKNLRLQRKVAANYSATLFWISLFGFGFLFARYAYIYLLSAEIFQVIILTWFVLATGYYLWRLKVGYPKKKKKAAISH